MRFFVKTNHHNQASQSLKSDKKLKSAKIESYIKYQFVLSSFFTKFSGDSHFYALIVISAARDWNRKKYWESEPESKTLFKKE